MRGFIFCLLLSNNPILINLFYWTKHLGMILGHVFYETEILIFLTSFSCRIFLGIFKLKPCSFLHYSCLRELLCRLPTSSDSLREFSSPSFHHYLRLDLSSSYIWRTQVLCSIPPPPPHSVGVMGEEFSWGWVQSFLEELVSIPFS